MTTDAPAAADPCAPTAKDLRIMAGGGFLLLAVALIAYALITLNDAVKGDGAAGALTTAGGWALWLSFFTGLAALALPATLLPRAPRTALVAAQYALLVAGPVLTALD